MSAKAAKYHNTCIRQLRRRVTVVLEGEQIILFVCVIGYQGATVAPQKPSEMFSKKSTAPLVPSVVALISVNPILGSDGVSCELDVSRGRGRLRRQSAVPVAAPNWR